MPKPLTPESDLPTADVTAGGDRDLDDLERRLAAFDSATKRLSKTIDTVETKAGESSRPSSGNRRAVPGTPVANDDISALRPAISPATATTGALTARRRSEGGQVTPGFTSAHGKPAIPVMPAAPAPAVASAMPASLGGSSRIVRSPLTRRRSLIAVAVIGAAVLAALAILTRSFREMPDAAVWAETSRVAAASSGVITALPLQIGDTVASGAVLARIGDTAVAAPCDGIVSRLLVAQGTRIAAGEPIAELARPETLRVVVALQGAIGVVAGERVSVRLLGQNRVCGGMIDRILAPGEPGAWSGSGSSPHRATIILDPASVPPALGQGARVTPFGSRDPSPLTLALFAIRRMLPW